MADHICPDCGSPCTCAEYALAGQCERCGGDERDFDWNDADEIAEAE